MSTEESDGSATFELAWDKATVSLEAIERALYALADRVTGSVVDGADVWLVSFHRRSLLTDVAELQHRLRQEVNDQALRLKIAERTDPIRNLVFALAFSRTGLVDGSAKQ